MIKKYTAITTLRSYFNKPLLLAVISTIIYSVTYSNAARACTSSTTVICGGTGSNGSSGTSGGQGGNGGTGGIGGIGGTGGIPPIVPGTSGHNGTGGYSGTSGIGNGGNGTPGSTGGSGYKGITGQGGQGGNGGTGGYGGGGGVGISNGSNGGQGGSGRYWNNTSTMSNSNTIMGGQGGTGGQGGAGGAGGNGGIGGTGGTGGTGGRGGAGGKGGTGKFGSTGGTGKYGGKGGIGGKGISGSNFSLNNSGTITGGIGGAGGTGGTGGRGGNGGRGGQGGTGGQGDRHYSYNYGGIGGRGGYGGAGGIGGTGGRGGYGGTGGTGVSGSSFTLNNNGTITGGRWGYGGTKGGGGSGGYGGRGGNGGRGGIGDSYGAQGSSITSYSLSGSSGGNGSAGGSGSGGVGLSSTGNSTIINAGAISGGINSNSTYAYAVKLSGSGNTLTLESGYSFTGNVVSTSNSSDTLGLGGDINDTFNVSNIVASVPSTTSTAAKYSGFTNYEKTGSSTWTLTDSTTKLTPWTIKEGILSVSSDNKLGATSGALTFEGTGGTLQSTANMTMARSVHLTTAGTFKTDANLILSGKIDGTSSLTKEGAGTLILTNANSYQGGTTITTGILQVGDGSVSGAGSITGDVEDNATFIFKRSGAVSLDDIISGSGELRQEGAGTLTLSGTNSYSGGTTIGAGTISASKDSNLGAATGALTFDGAGGILQSTADMTMARSVHLTTAGTFDINDSKSLAILGVIDDSGNNSKLTKTGAGTLILSGANSYAGGTTIDAGTISASNDSNLGAATGALTFSNTSAGILKVTGNTFKSTDRTIVLGNTGGGFDIDNADNNFTVAQDLSGTGSLTKIGAGTLTLSGTNSYSGGTTIGAGTISASKDSNLGAATGALTFDGTGGTLQSTANMTMARSVHLTTAGTFNTNNSTALTLSGKIDGTSSLTKEGAGTLILSGTNIYSGGTTIASGTLSVSQDTNLGDTTANGTNNALTFEGTGGTLQSTANMTMARSVHLTTAGTFKTDANLILSGKIDGTSSLTKEGAGTLILTNANSYQGGTTITTGILQVGDGSVSGAGSITGDVEDNATFIFKRSGAVSLDDIISGSGELRQEGAGTLTLSGTNSYSGGTTIGAGTISASKDSNLGAATGALTFDGAGGILQSTADMTMARSVHLTTAGTFDINDSKSLAILGVIDDSGNNSKLTKTGAGTLILSGANSYAGGTTIDAGTISASNDSNLGAATGALTFSNTSAGILKVTGNTFKSTDRTIVLGNTGGGFDIDNADNNFTVAQDLSGTGSLTKIGAGTLTLSGTNSYSGGTTIGAGTISASKDSNLGAATGALTFDGTGGTLQSTANMTMARSVHLTTAGTFNTNNSTALTLSGKIDGNSSLTKEGAGSLILTNANTYQGGTTITTGTLQVGDDSHLGASIKGDVTVTGIASVKNLGNISGVGGINITATGGNESNHINITNTNQASSTTGIIKATDTGSSGINIATNSSNVVINNDSSGDTSTNNSTISGVATGINIVGDNSTINNYGNGLIKSTNGIGISVAGDNTTIINNDKSTISGATGIKITGNNTQVVNKSNFTVKGTNVGVDISTDGSVITADLQNIGGTIKATADSGVAISVAASGTKASPITISNKVNTDTGTGGTIEATGTDGIGIQIAKGSNYITVINGDNSDVVSTISGTASGEGINIAGNHATITNNKTGAIKGIAIAATAENTIITNYADDSDDGKVDSKRVGILDKDGNAAAYNVTGISTTIDNYGIFSQGIDVGDSTQNTTITNNQIGIIKGIAIAATAQDTIINNYSDNKIAADTDYGFKLTGKNTTLNNYTTGTLSGTTAGILVSSTSAQKATINNIGGTVKSADSNNDSIGIDITATGDANNYTTVTNIATVSGGVLKKANITGKASGISISANSKYTKVINGEATASAHVIETSNIISDTYGINLAGSNTNITNNHTGYILGVSNGIKVATTSENSTIDNSGIIEAKNGAAIKVLGKSTTINNNEGGVVKYTGEKTTDYHNAAIYTDAEATVSNQGTIDGGNSDYAITGTLVAQQTVNIYTGSKITGIIDLAADAEQDATTGITQDIINMYDNGSKGSYIIPVRHEQTTDINIKPGSNALKIDKGGNLVSIQDRTSYAGGLIAVVNATGAATLAISLNDLTSNLHGIISNSLQHIKVNKKTKVAALQLSPGMLDQQNTPQLWGQVFGARSNRDAEGALSAYENESSGFIGGYQYAVGKGELGVVAGFAKATLTTDNNNQDNDTNSAYVGAYAQTNFGKLNLIDSVIAGQESHDNRRKVANGLGNTETAKSNNSSVFLSPSVTLYSSVKLNDQLSLRPSTSLNYSIGRYAKYKETGAGLANIKVPARTTDAALANMQLELAYAAPVGEVDLTAGVQERYSDNDDIDMSIAGSDFSYKSGIDSTVYGDYVGVDAHVSLKKGLNLAITTRYSEFNGGEHQISGQAQLRYSF